MTLDTWAYRDPEQVLMRKQAIEAAKLKQCGDCEHHTQIVLMREAVHGCDVKGKTYGYQCSRYEAAKVAKGHE